MSLHVDDVITKLVKEKTHVSLYFREVLSEQLSTNFLKLCVGSRDVWESRDANMTDNYGRNWTFSERLTLQHSCYTACMMSVVVTQWANLIACKTRINSIVKQGKPFSTLNDFLETLKGLQGWIIISLQQVYLSKLFLR